MPGDHVLGMLGRRIYTDQAYWHLLNLIATIGAAILGLAVLVFIVCVAAPRAQLRWLRHILTLL